MKNFSKFLEEIDCCYKINEPMALHTTFKIGGRCKILASPNNEEQISLIIKKCKETNISFYILGKGSNLLVNDGGIDGVVIHLGSLFSSVELIDETTIVCDAGAPLAKVCYFAYQNGLTGMEFAWGIPGTVGGAAYMNAGAYDGEIKNIIVSCDHIDENGDYGTYSKEELDFGYRHSVYSFKNFCITKVKISLQKGDICHIRSKMDDLMHRRKTKQPMEMPSAGSTFKRPNGSYASALIDQCGLRGFRVGDAMVSDKHCGFVVNTGNASCEEVLTLIAKIKQIVYEKTGYSLECEVKMI
ncbi:MAG: murB [Oscillospiraceae bacterium]|jgi:UDP-N-acetylmuramate dehydrogenase|nr:murB [Oscillospiraceae bacterium]